VIPFVVEKYATNTPSDTPSQIDENSGHTVLANKQARI